MIHNIESYVHEGVIIEKLKDYDRNDRFTHICLPYNWLLTN